MQQLYWIDSQDT